MFDELISPLLTTAWGRRAGIITAALMAFIFSLILIREMYYWWSDSHILKTPGQIVTISSNKEILNQLIAEIPNKHLFGNPEVTKSEVLPITSLQLRLVGVIKDVNAGASGVIISESGRPGKVYRIGDSLTSGVKVHEITEDGVILENGGRLEKLRLDRQPLIFKSKPTTVGNSD